VSVSKPNVTLFSASQWRVRTRAALIPSDSVRLVTGYPYAALNNIIPYLCHSFLYSCTCASFLCVCQFLVHVPVSCACASFLGVCQLLVRVPASCAWASFVCVCQFLVRVSVSCASASFLNMFQFLAYMPVPRPFWKPFDTLFLFIWLQL
jgi:hypothetical protein